MCRYVHHRETNDLNELLDLEASVRCVQVTRVLDVLIYPSRRYILILLGGFYPLLHYNIILEHIQISRYQRRVENGTLPRMKDCLAC